MADLFMVPMTQLSRGRSMSVQARREQEFEAVQAIYGDDVAFHQHRDHQLIKLKITSGSLFCVLCIIIDVDYPATSPVSISIEEWHNVLTDSMIGELNLKLDDAVRKELAGEEVLHALYEITREFLEQPEDMYNCILFKSPSTDDLSASVEPESDHESISSIEPIQATCLSHSSSLEHDDDVAYRAVTLDFLIKFTCEHDLWHVPTHKVVSDIIIPTMTATEHGGPYTSILPMDEVGRATIFISHAWSNSFGLAVAAVRKYIGDHSSRQDKRRDKKEEVFIWMDIFAVTQEKGDDQMHDLSQLEPTIAYEKCRTLVVLDEDEGTPLKRCWCIFEIYATLYHCGLKYSGKLQVRAGKVVGRYGEFQPCSNRDKLVELASNVDASSALCTVESDKHMILQQIDKLGGTDRNGLHELNRILQRAVRHGWG